MTAEIGDRIRWNWPDDPSPKVLIVGPDHELYWERVGWKDERYGDLSARLDKAVDEGVVNAEAREQVLADYLVFVEASGMVEVTGDATAELDELARSLSLDAAPDLQFRPSKFIVHSQRQ